MDWIKKNWGIIALVVVVLLLLDKCRSNPIKTIVDSKPEVIYRDSIREVEVHVRDTVDRWRDRVVYRNIPMIGSEPLEPGMDLSDTLEFYKTKYYYQQKDSLLDAIITVISTARPDSVGIDYSVLERTITDSTYVKDRIEEKVRTNQLWFGGTASPTHVGVGVDFVQKKGWQLEAGVMYDFNGNRFLPMVGYKKLISFRKKR